MAKTYLCGTMAVIRPAVGVAVCALICCRASASTITFDNDCGNAQWSSMCSGNTITNWSDNAIPGAMTDVSIPMGSPIVQMLQNAFAQSITCDSGLNNLGVVFQLGAGGGFISNLEMSGTFSAIQFMAPGTELNLQSNTKWTVGAVTGNGTVINVGGNVNPSIFSSAMTLNLQNDGKFRNEAGGDATLRFVQINANCEFKNDAGATFTLWADGVGGYLKGPGFFTNAGDFTIEFPVSTSREIGAFFNQTSGQFIVEGATNSLGAYFTNAGSFTGGTITVNDNCYIHFQHPGAEVLPYVFNGLSTISGFGNVVVEIPFFAPATADWQVIAPLTVNLSGTDGFVIGGNRLTLGDVLTNSGKAQWLGGTIRNTTLGGGEFRNDSNDFTIAPAGTFVTLATLFRNNAVVRQSQGNLIIGAGGVMAVVGEYQLIRGDIQQSTPNISNGVVVFGTLRKPDTAQTQDSTISAEFAIPSEGQVIIEKNTLFISPSNSHLFSFYGGKLQINAGATARHIGGGIWSDIGSGSTFGKIQGEGRFTVETPVSAENSLSCDDDTGLDFNMTGTTPSGCHFISGRMGGGGLRNLGNFYWSGGTMGMNFTSTDDLRFFNAGTLYHSGGTIEGDEAYFDNLSTGVVQQTGTLSMVKLPADSTAHGPVITNKNIWNMTPGVGPGTFSIGSGGEFRNETNALLHVSAPSLAGIVNMTTKLDNNGVVQVGPNSRLNLQGEVVGYVNGEITKGSWIVEPGGILDFPGTGIIRAIGEGVTLTGNSASLPSCDLDQNDGELLCNDDMNCTGPFTNTGDLLCDEGAFACGDDFSNFGGTCTIDDGATCDVNGDFLNDHGTLSCSGGMVECDEVQNGPINQFSALGYAEDVVVVGRHRTSRGGAFTAGYFCNTFHNNAHGVIRPGGVDAVGPFRITGNLVQHAGGAIQIELDGTTPVTGHDQLQVDGDVSLNGILSLSILPGYQPKCGEQYTILTATGSITGTFAQIAGPGQYTIQYNPGSVVVTLVSPPKIGDLNNDGMVNVTDLFQLLAAWGLCANPCPPSCAADLNSDCNVNVSDLFILLANWG